MRSLRLAFLLAFLVPSLVTPAGAKEDWQSEMLKWAVSNDTNPNCKVRFTVGIYRPDMGDKPAWGVMNEKMFRWFSKDGVKLAPSVCPKSRYSKDKIAYRILFSVSPMKMVSQTTHGSEVHTTSEPFSANVNSRTTYSDGSTANGTATINGQQTSTVVVPTETTISQSSVALYMYTYRVNGDQLELIGSDSVVFSRVGVSSSSTDAAASQLGAGIGNLIRASGDRHRADKLYEEALKAIRADAQDGITKHDAHPESYASENVPTDTQGTHSVVAPILIPTALSASPSTAQAPANVSDLPSAQTIDTPKERSATDDAETQFHLGTLYETGKGVPQDYAQAVLWYRKAAEQNLAIAQYRLGVLYANGVGVPQDKAQGATYLLLAAKQGCAPAYGLIGGDYLMGNGVSQDYGEAYFWYSLATLSPTQGPAVLAQANEVERDGAALYLSQFDLSRLRERVQQWLEDHPTKPQ